MRIWLTGGSGMLGSAVKRALRTHGSGAEIVAPSSSEVDLRQAECVREFVASVKPDAVVHAAGKVGGIAANLADPVGFLTDNLAIGMNVIRTSHDAGIPRLINVGSSCMYPRDHDDALLEDDILSGPLEPTNEGYALAKIACDRLCDYIARTYGRAYRTLVPSNLYGPGDHYDEQRGHLIANAIRKVELAVRSDADVVEVWGDGTARREFTFVDDVARWIAVLAIEGVDQLPGRVNVGMGVDHTVREYYERIGALCGYEGSFSFDLTKPVGMRRKLMDSTLAADFGWVAATGLDDGLAQTIAAYREALVPA